MYKELFETAAKIIKTEFGISLFGFDVIISDDDDTDHVCLLTHSLTYSLTPLLTHSLTHSLTYSLTYSLTPLLIAGTRTANNRCKLFPLV